MKIIIKFIALTAVVVIAVIALVGCGAAGTTNTQISEVTSATLPPVVQETYGEEAYIDNVLAEYPNLLNSMGKPWVINFANVACDAIDEGSSLTDFANMATQYDVDATMIGFLLAQSIINFCPDNQWFIDAATNA